MPIIIGTGGHVDHGKTLLVTKLTGDDTDLDRWAEEKKRGLTIDLGFAFLKNGKGEKISIVDVPGHEDFVNNMVVGASGIDIGLLVIAADDSVMPQTVEHMEIMHLLGIKDYVAAISKVDIVEDEMVDIVEEDVMNLFGNYPGSLLHTIFRTSAKEGTGIDELRSYIIDLSEKTEKEKSKEGFFRMPVDRTFSIKGFGTVVTGSLISGEVHKGDEIEIVPQNTLSRVRRIEVDDNETECAVRGQRTALNLSDVKKDEVKRGNQVCVPGFVKSVFMINTLLKTAVSLKNPINNRSSVRFMSGTGSVIAKIEILDADKIVPGDNDHLVQLRLSEPAPVKNQDRFILRNLSPEITIAGGIVLEISPVKVTRNKKKHIERLERLMQSTPAQRIEEFFKTNLHTFRTVKDAALEENRSVQNVSSIIDNELKGALVMAGDRIQHKDSFEFYTKEIEEVIQRFHRHNPYDTGITVLEIKNTIPRYFNGDITDSILRELIKKEYTLEKGKYAAKDFSISLSRDEQDLSAKIVSFMMRAETKFAPPSRKEITEDLSAGKTFEDVWHYLNETKKLIEIERGIFFPSQILEEIKQVIRDHLKNHENIDVKTLRNILDNSRKFSIALMEYFDKSGFTQRMGDVRVLKETAE